MSTIVRDNNAVQITFLNGTKNAFFFLSRAPSRNSFTFNLRFSNELKYKVRLSKTVCEVYHIWFRFAFIIQQSAWTLWLWNVIIPSKTKIMEKPRKVLLPDLWLLSCKKNFKIQWYVRQLELPKNWTGDKFFKLRKPKVWEC